MNPPGNHVLKAAAGGMPAAAMCRDGLIVAITNERLEQTPSDADTFVYGVEGPEVLIEALRPH